MKNILIIILCVVLFNITSTFANTRQDLIGIWTGKYSENDGKETVTSDCTIILTRYENNYLYGAIKYDNYSNGHKKVIVSLKAYCTDLDGNDSFIFDHITFDQITKKKSVGTMGFVVSIQDGKKVMRGRFFPKKGSDNPNFIMVDLYNSTENGSKLKIDNIPLNNNTSLATKPPITLDASELDDFYQGFAIIRKGENFALIRKSGDLETTKGGSFLVPYGKYTFNTKQGFKIDKEKCGFSYGMCAVRDPDSEMYGFIDLTGKLIVSCTLTDVTKYMSDGYAWAKQKDAQGREEQIYIDNKGNKFRLKDQSLYNHNVLDAYSISNNGFRDFYSKSGKFLFKTKRHTWEGFSEGLIRVDTTYEMSGEKSGYMNLKGQLVIPYKFKGNSYNFHNGLAFYEPPTSDEFKYIYINKKGVPVIKLHSTDVYKNIHFYDSGYTFYAGYSLGDTEHGPILLDKNGSMFFIADAIEQNNPDITSKYSSFKVDHDIKRSGNYIKFEANYDVTVQEKFVSSGINGGHTITHKVEKPLSGYGIADLTGKIIIPPLYNRIGFPDPVSGYAKYMLVVPYNGESVEAEGYTSGAATLEIIKALGNKEKR